MYAGKNFTAELKRFGSVKLSAGYYYYIGSAQKNLQQRIDRHLKKEKKLFWHIDYLTTNPSLSIKNIITFSHKEKSYECVLVNRLSMKYNLLYPIKKFGNSDCRNCESHLLYSKRPIIIERDE